MEMDKEPRKLVFHSTPVIFLLILSLLYFVLFLVNFISFDQCKLLRLLHILFQNSVLFSQLCCMTNSGWIFRCFMKMAGKKNTSNSETIFNSRKVNNETLEEKQNSLDFLLSSLLAGRLLPHPHPQLVTPYE